MATIISVSDLAKLPDLQAPVITLNLNLRKLSFDQSEQLRVKNMLKKIQKEVGDDIAPFIADVNDLTREQLPYEGMTVIADQTRKPLGIFTDGDLRRLIMQRGDIRPMTAGQVMTPHPRTISPEALAAEAAAVMEQQKLSTMLVVNQEQTLVGALHMHDLMDAKVI